MTAARSDLMGLAEEIQNFEEVVLRTDDGPEWSDKRRLTDAEQEMIVSALRLAASQPDREAIARAIEGIILRRVYEKRIEGYTLEMSLEQTDAILALLSVKGGGVQGSIADCGQCNEHSGRQLSPAWQPIETAPHDKTIVALLHVAGTYRRYGVSWYMPLTGWEGWNGDYQPPTHWSPLPTDLAVAETDVVAQRDDGLLSGVSADPDPAPPAGGR